MKSSRLTFTAAVFAIVAGHLLCGRAIGWPPGTASASDRIAEAAIPACTKENLSIKAGEGDAAMGGVREIPFIITNTSSSSCTVTGYPSLDLLNKAGAVVKRATRQKSDDPIAPVALEPGKTASFMLNYNAGGAGYMGKPCPTYSRVRISVPGISGSWTLKAGVQTCAKTNFEVSALRTGSPE